MRIGTVEIKGHTALAPMAGVADTAFRTVCKGYGAGYVVGEMVSAKGLCMANGRSAQLLRITDAERPMAVQLFGSDPEVMAEAARIAMAFAPDIIDINMGCPAPKVTATGAGSALLKNPELAGRIISEVAGAVAVPVTVKLRKGWDEGSVNVVEMARLAQDCGAAAVTVHGRTRAQQYAPPADLSCIAQVKRAVSIPVIGNGDVTSPEKAAEMLKKTGCDLVMIGRGALGNPWIFERTERLLSGGDISPMPDAGVRMQVMLSHIRLLCECKGEYVGVREARRHAAYYMRGLNGAAMLRAYAVAAERLEQFEDIAREAVRLNQRSEL